MPADTPNTDDVTDVTPIEPQLPTLQRAKVDLPALMGQHGNVQEILERLGAPSSNMLRVSQSKSFILPDGTEMAGPIPFVIVDFVAESRWYESAYNRNAIVPPACAALNVKPTMLAPFDDSPNKQADTCAGCPQNQWGSGPNGGKACTNSRLLALLDPMAEPGSPLLKLRISATAISPFEAYIRQLAKVFGKAHFMVLSWIGFDPQSQYSSVRVGQPAPLDAGVLPIGGRQLDGIALLQEAVERQAEAREMLMAKPDFTVTAPAAQNPRQAPQVRGNRRAAV
jgi:hypothetical protein